MARAATPTPRPIRRAGTEPPPPPPAYVGPYELVSQIARGGMGAVYLCRRAAPGGFQRLSALKLMHRHLAEDKEFLAMFLDEARLAARIHHPNVVSILGLGVSTRGHHVVMEYVEGCTLAQLVQKSATHPSPRVLAPIAIDFLTGLHAAHVMEDEHGVPLEIVHRDVSPTNVLVGVDGVARIADFGVARARARITSTRPGTYKGKLAYAAPELLLGQRGDARADIFATGVVLWNALTGRGLFHGDTDAAIVSAVLHKEIPAPSTVGAAPPTCFDPVVMRALERAPANRYPTAEAMADALRSAAQRAGLLGTPSEVGRAVAQASKRELGARKRAVRAATERGFDDSPRGAAAQVAERTPTPEPAPLPTPPPLPPPGISVIERPLELPLPAPEDSDATPAPRRSRGWIGVALAMVAMFATAAAATAAVMKMRENRDAATKVVEPPPEPAMTADDDNELTLPMPAPIVAPEDEPAGVAREATTDAADLPEVTVPLPPKAEPATRRADRDRARRTERRAERVADKPRPRTRRRAPRRIRRDAAPAFEPPRARAGAPAKRTAEATSDDVLGPVVESNPYLRRD